MARPERIRKIQLRVLIPVIASAMFWDGCPMRCETKTTTQAITTTTIVLMAGIMGIDESLFESARIDGASSTHVFFDITLPLLRPILVYTMITSLIGGLQMFDVPQVLSKGIGMPNRTTFTVIMLLNNYLGGSKNYGMAGAISVILFIITGILSIFVFKAMNRKEA